MIFILAYREHDAPSIHAQHRLKRSRRSMSYAVNAALRSNGKAGNGFLADVQLSVA